MATYVGSHGEVSSSFYRHPPTTTSTSTASSVSANMGPTNTTMPTFSKASEGLEGVPVRTFITIENMQEAIDSYGGSLETSKAGPYLIFRLVTTDNLLEIERGRDRGEISRGVRMTHYVDWNILIVKVPTTVHELAYGNFSDRLVAEATRMGLLREMSRVGSKTYKTLRVSKEGDTAFKPRSMRPRDADWPTIVFEAGWSAKLDKLRRDAHTWLENSRGDVKIVLLFSIGRTSRTATARPTRTMIIEKWENRPVPANPPVPTNRPVTRSITRALAIPTQIQAITINSNSNTVNGAPLTLEFQKIFLRQAVPPLEHDFTFTRQNLLEFANDIWTAVL